MKRLKDKNSMLKVEGLAFLVREAADVGKEVEIHALSAGKRLMKRLMGKRC